MVLLDHEGETTPLDFYKLPIMTTLPNEETMAKMAELAADSVRQRIMDEYGDLIHDAVGDALLEVLGETDRLALERIIMTLLARARTLGQPGAFDQRGNDHGR